MHGFSTKKFGFLSTQGMSVQDFYWGKESTLNNALSTQATLEFLALNEARFVRRRSGLALKTSRGTKNATEKEREEEGERERV